MSPPETGSDEEGLAYKSMVSEKSYSEKIPLKPRLLSDSRVTSRFLSARCESLRKVSIL